MRGDQSLLSQPDPPTLEVVLDEASLHRSIGGPKVMREQFRRLVEVAALPRVTVQVLPFATGAHGALVGAFTILGFPEPAEPDVVYLEHTVTDLYLEDADEISGYRSAFVRLQDAALGPDDSRSLLTAMMAGKTSPNRTPRRARR